MEMQALTVGYLHDVKVFPEYHMPQGACGSLVVKALCYKMEGHGFNT
jgi:hypothetical protein